MGIRTVAVLASLAATAASYAGDGTIRVPQGAQTIAGQYIVVFSDDVGLVRGAESDVRDLATRLTDQYGGDVERTYAWALRGATVRVDEATARKIAADPRVKYVEQDALSRIVGDQSNPTWGIDRVDERSLPLDNNYHWDFTGSGVEVYVIDTGIRTSHVDYAGRAVWGADCIGTGLSDNNGHGTHVAGTVGSATWGVAKDATLVAVKVCNGGGSCPNSAITCGIDYVTQRKLNNPSIPMVANMSLGGGFSQSENDAVDGSVNAGVFYAVAAGNDNGFNACNLSPASAPNAYTVGSTTSSDARSSFSNIGVCLDIFAPGSSITSTWNTSNTATNTISGTSMATPHVAGAAALVFDQNPTWTPFQVQDELTARATVGVVSNPGSGSPNLLLYTLDDGGGPPPPPAPECASDALNLNGFSFTGAAGQNQANNFNVTDGGVQIDLLGNTWVRTTSDFTVGSGTTLEFYFRSSNQGEIHGIGFDENDTLNDDPRYFQFWGTQNWTGTGQIDLSPTYGGSGDWQFYSVDVGANYTGSMSLAFVNDKDSGSGTNESQFRCVRVVDDSPPGGGCSVDIDFESGADGWFNDGASTCSTGAYVLGNPTQQSNGGVTTQVGGSNSGSNSVFTATNTSPGNADVDGGNCILGSPVWSVSAASTLSVAWFHGQRDGNDDSGDGFAVEYSLNGGSSWSTLVSNGDTQSNAAWATSSASIPAGSDVALRVQCTDATGGGDLVECGIDDVKICN
ncbi:MAG: S8 family peptidase [Pseudomonadota bacterium]